VESSADFGQDQLSHPHGCHQGNSHSSDHHEAAGVALYANEADLLNFALFGQTAKQWREAHPDAEGNIRDLAPLEQLVVLTNLESLNSILIRQGLSQPERLRNLNEIAISQMRTLLAANNVKRLK
jgi:hypothetical protein